MFQFGQEPRADLASAEEANFPRLKALKHGSIMWPGLNLAHLDVGRANQRAANLRLHHSEGSAGRSCRRERVFGIRGYPPDNVQLHCKLRRRAGLRVESPDPASWEIL